MSERITLNGHASIAIRNAFWNLTHLLVTLFSRRDKNGHYCLISNSVFTFYQFWTKKKKIYMNLFNSEVFHLVREPAVKWR